ncbi:MAG: hypothetical protein V4673_14425 [Pseudomonadota bacterium]
MIDRQHGTIQFQCDRCLAVLETDTKEFADASAAAKRDGWTFMKLGKDWLHKCGACKGKIG